MTVSLVTAYVELPGHPRPAADYRASMGRLASLPVSVMSSELPLKHCWLFEWLEAWKPAKITHSEGDNPRKNTLAYHIVLAEKTNLLWHASMASPQTDVFVWVDCGIYHLPDITDRMIVEFAERVDGEKTIALPGCWDEKYDFNDLLPCWRYCGGVLVVPRRYVVPFDVAMKHKYVHKVLRSNQVTWEVNMLGRVELEEPELPIFWYQADHDASMFTAYKPVEAVR